MRSGGFIWFYRFLLFPSTLSFCRPRHTGRPPRCSQEELRRNPDSISAHQLPQNPNSTFKWSRNDLKAVELFANWFDYYLAPPGILPVQVRQEFVVCCELKTWKSLLLFVVRSISCDMLTLDSPVTSSVSRGQSCCCCWVGSDVALTSKWKPDLSFPFCFSAMQGPFGSPEGKACQKHLCCVDALDLKVAPQSPDPPLFLSSLHLYFHSSVVSHESYLQEPGVCFSILFSCTWLLLELLVSS